MNASTPSAGPRAEMSRQDFERFAALVHRHAGISMGEMKYELLRARIGKRLRALGMTSFRDYYEIVTQDSGGLELDRMIDVVTTNKTDFFRERGHFGHLARELAPGGALSGPKPGPLRIWSAACSSGEEPYTLAMVLLEALGPERPFKILATDISSSVLHRAMEGIYPAEKLADLPPGYRECYFEAKLKGGERLYSAGPALRAAVQFSRFNLADGAAYLFDNAFDAIFCRNVMIYFDRPTQEAVVGHLSRQLAPGGILYTGFSESLIGVRHSLRPDGASVYRKPAN